MKLVKMRTLGMFGIGFLAGSRAGTGPWEKAQAGIDQLKGKMNSGDGGSTMSTTDGFNSQRGNHTQKAALTEM